MTTKKLTISIPIEYAAYLEQRTISPSKLLQKAIKEIMAHDIYYKPNIEKVDTHGKPKYTRTDNGKRPRERRK